MPIKTRRCLGCFRASQLSVPVSSHSIVIWPTCAHSIWPTPKAMSSSCQTEQRRTAAFRVLFCTRVGHSSLSLRPATAPFRYAVGLWTRTPMLDRQCAVPVHQQDRFDISREKAPSAELQFFRGSLGFRQPGGASSQKSASPALSHLDLPALHCQHVHTPATRGGWIPKRSSASSANDYLCPCRTRCRIATRLSRVKRDQQRRY